MKLTESEKAKRYDLIIKYFGEILSEREDEKIGEFIYYDEWKKPRHKDEVERQEEVVGDFQYQMEDIGFLDFGEFIIHEIYGECMSDKNQFKINLKG